MIKTFTAVFDGEVLRPEEPLGIAPNTRVRITLEIRDRKCLSPEEILTLATSVYDGLTEKEIKEVEQIALQRDNSLEVQKEEEPKGEPYSSLRLASSLKLDGPSDFSERLEDYLYGDSE